MLRRGRDNCRRAYEDHCQRHGVRPLGGKAFSDRLKKLGCDTGRNNAMGRFWTGIGLIHNPEPAFMVEGMTLTRRQ